ncbi:MAG: MarR family transcriptional regulator [Actinomycetales bacterium]|nr:MarR family transcriptional regulator [Actinomycetales bacterium]
MKRPVDLTVLYLIKQVELAVRSRLDEVLAERDLTSLQYTALTVLERHPGMTAAALARNSFVRAQTMAQMVGHLEERGLVARRRDPHNRRQHLIELTEDGQGALDELRERVEAVEALALSGLTQAEALQLRAALRSVRVALGGVLPH